MLTILTRGDAVAPSKTHPNAGTGWLILVILMTALGCGQGSPEPPAGGADTEMERLTRVSIQLNWFPEVEHGGVYAAQLREYFKEAGIEATIHGGGPGIPVEQLVGRGEADFGVTNADKVLIARARGVPVVALLAPIQESPRCILVHPDSGITQLDQIANLTLSCGVADPYIAFLKGRLPFEGVRFVPYNFTQFLVDKNFAVQGYTFSEPILARQRGVESNVLMVREAGYDPYTSVLITSEEMLAGRPALVEAVTRAVAEGWNSYYYNSDPVNSHIMELNDQMPFEVMSAAVLTLDKTIYTPEVRETGRLGMMTRERWQAMADALAEAGAIKPGEVDVDKAFTTAYIEPMEIFVSVREGEGAGQADE